MKVCCLEAGFVGAPALPLPEVPFFGAVFFLPLVGVIVFSGVSETSDTSLSMSEVISDICG